MLVFVHFSLLQPASQQAKYDAIHIKFGVLLRISISYSRSYVRLHRVVSKILFKVVLIMKSNRFVELNKQPAAVQKKTIFFTKNTEIVN